VSALGGWDEESHSWHERHARKGPGSRVAAGHVWGQSPDEAVWAEAHVFLAFVVADIAI
jgi:hypothetical protein